MITLRKVLPLVVLGLWWAPAGAAMACADVTCEAVWKLDQTTYSDCNNLPFLSPGNDTRVNLQLMLIDAGLANIGPAPKTDPPTTPITASASPFTWEGFSDLIGPKSPDAPADDAADAGANADFASGEGSRCRSNNDGAKAFKAALDSATGVPATERTALDSARDALAPTCDDTTSAAYSPPANIRSPLGLQFTAYLSGTANFYGGDFAGARSNFGGLQNSSQPWLKETARYMIARAALNQAQAQAFDEYGALSTGKVDAAALQAADQGFQAYLQAYPKGLYAASARGLLRRVDWLGNQPQKLADAYTTSFAHLGAGEQNVSLGDLVMEADAKLLTSVNRAKVKAPVLLATLDLMSMRGPTPYADAPPPVIKFDELAAQKPLFAGQPDLFQYLLAAHRFYIEADPAGALSYLGAAPAPGRMNNLAFSREVLRGEALEAQKNWAGARQLWLQMAPQAAPVFQRPMLDLALASNYEHDGKLTTVFAAGTPIRDPEVREILLRYDAPPALLVERIKASDAAARERRVSRYVLLYKDLLRARYSAFAGDAALSAPKATAAPDPNDPQGEEPDQAIFDWPGSRTGYACEDLRKVAAMMAANPRQSHALLCLGEFVRAKGLESDPLDTPPPADELGGAPTLFAGPVFSRLDGYELIIADAKAPADDRAYALYRAINCYGPSGHNQCGGHDVPQSERARWYHLLKTSYPDSAWAHSLKYYW